MWDLPLWGGVFLECLPFWGAKTWSWTAKDASVEEQKHGPAANACLPRFIPPPSPFTPLPPQVKKLLATAKNMDALLEAVPDLLNPKALLSVLVTVNKWWVHAWAGLG